MSFASASRPSAASRTFAAAMRIRSWSATRRKKPIRMFQQDGSNDIVNQFGKLAR